MIEIKSPAQIAKMRESGKLLAHALDEMSAAAKPGVTLKEIDSIGKAILDEAGAKSPFLNYHPAWAPTPFPGVICASVNDVIVHGIPGDYLLKDGDLLSIDFGVVLDGWCSDAARTIAIGSVSASDQKLSDVTREALYAGIAAAQLGNTLGDIGFAISQLAKKNKFGILDDHGGHGIGSEMHMEPFLPNVGKRGKGTRLREGMVLAIEPMFIADGSGGYKEDADGWTLRTRRGAKAAHWEHSVAITADGPVVLTASVSDRDGSGQ